MGDFDQARTHMVDNQLRTNDVTDLRVLDAMEAIPRERFVPASKRCIAYSDQDIAVSGEGATRYLMKPHVFAKMVQLADISENDVVLSVGCATGYSVAVLSRLAGSVVGLEEDAPTAEAASALLVELGIENAAILDGALATGGAAEGPYDVILVDGAVEDLPETLTAQLKDGGRLVVIEGQGGAAVVKLYTRSGDVVSGRFAFNASAHLLPGFARPKAFVF
ncbi:protein-L-isoaspartate O-methyltransferase family protein [Stappia indica]|uniref:protein-L-isoaspartate O-methyltransferase family protein n=1 Tax=Stappia indica TaxID=538381 RepID=UPI001CD72D5A|nr:protein-L-isoaspartate O-methyltransferase [Stappia indica]MCA1296943.1 protein-L-isoaspartate O-methyltransferase [Stappia indica]